LGLFISQSLVHLLNGSKLNGIDIISPLEGGTIFQFRLKISDDQLEIDSHVGADTKPTLLDSDENARRIKYQYSSKFVRIASNPVTRLDEGVNTNPESGITGSEARNQGDFNLETECLFCREPFISLLVDDNPFNLLALKTQVKTFGVRFETAVHGADALERVQKSYENRCSDSCRLYPVILMDLDMPVMDGLEATQRIKEFLESKGHRNSVQIAACSANVVQDAKMKLFDKYLCKPVLREHLETLFKIEDSSFVYNKIDL
jgi:CheY-like chemotaxis protein